MKRTLIYFFLFYSTIVLSQESKDTVFTKVDKMPEFKGGEQEFTNYIYKHIHYIPDLGDIIGKVYISFIINEIGNIDSVKVVKSLYEAYDKDAQTVIQNMPKWSPGTHHGKPVKVRQTIPIKYMLR
jgi:protein TonB